MMPAGTVDMSMGHFLGRGIANFANSDVEVEIFARERMIGVERDFITFNLGDCHDLRTARPIALQLHADFQIPYSVDSRAGNDNDFVGILEAVGFFRRHIDLELVANGPALKSLFQAGDDLPAAVNVTERPTAFGSVDDNFVVVSKRIVEQDDFAG